MYVRGDSTLNNTRVRGAAVFEGVVRLNHAASLAGGVTIGGAAHMTGTLAVEGATTLKAGLLCSGEGLSLAALHDVTLGTNLFDTVTRGAGLY